MIDGFREIRVFISSRCVGDYAAVRKKLYELLSNSMVFEPFMFEELGATSCRPVEAYTRELIDCDICVFIIRKGDGFSDGVLNEIDSAIKHKKKSFFYFCGYDAYPEELESRVSKPSISVYKCGLKKLDEVPQIAFNDLQIDVLNVYRGYCNGYYIADEDLAGSSGSYEYPKLQSTNIPKELISSIDATVGVFSEFIIGNSDEGCDASNDYDMYCSKLARGMLFDGGIEAFDWEQLIEAAKNQLGDIYDTEIIGYRWKSIASYYKQDYISSLNYMEKAYEKAKEANAPEWLLKDITIDLRNIDSVEHFFSEYQKLLDQSETALTYPLLDREKLYFCNDIIDERQKSIERSIYAVTYGDKLNSPIEHLSRIFMIAAIFGSLTYLLNMRQLLETFALYLCQKYGNDAFGSFLLTVLLQSGDSKRIERVFQSMDNIDCVKSSNEAYRIYLSVSKCASPVHKLAAHFEAFHRLGTYMKGMDYTSASVDFMSAAQNYKCESNRDISAGVALISAIQSNAKRLDAVWSVKQIIRMIETGSIEMQKRSFVAIKNGCIDVELLNKDMLSVLIDTIGTAVKANTGYLGFDAAIALSVLCQEDSSIKEKCIICAEESLDDRNLEIFRTELLIDDADYTLKRIDYYLGIIERGNEKQGTNGIWSHSAVAEFLNAANLIENLEDPSYDLLHRAAKAALDSLKNKKRFLGEKHDACILFLRLLSLPSIDNIEDLGITKDDICEIRTEGIDSPIMTELYSVFNLSIDKAALMYAVGMLSASKVEALLIETYGAREFDQAMAAQILEYMVRAIKANKLDDKLSSFLLAYAGALYQSPSFQIRIVTIELLFAMLEVPSMSNDVARQLVDSYDSKSPNEKCRIIRKQDVIQSANNQAWIDLKRKSLNDLCCISRSVAEEFFSQE